MITSTSMEERSLATSKEPAIAELPKMEEEGCRPEGTEVKMTTSTSMGEKSLAASKEPSISELHKYILSLIAMQGAVLLSLKQQKERKEEGCRPEGTEVKMITSTSMGEKSLATSKEPSISELHKYILSLISMHGTVLSLKQQRAGMPSLLDIDEPNFGRISVAFTFFGGASIGAAYILKACPNSDWGKFLSTLGHLFGALTYILVLVILVPALEKPALLFWFICFVIFIGVSSYEYLKTLFTGAVRAFGNLQDFVENRIIARCFPMKHDEETGSFPMKRDEEEQSGQS